MGPMSVAGVPLQIAQIEARRGDCNGPPYSRGQRQHPKRDLGEDLRVRMLDEQKRKPIHDGGLVKPYIRGGVRNRVPTALTTRINAAAPKLKSNASARARAQ